MLVTENTCLNVAHTADPDDAFAWWAIANNHVVSEIYKIKLVSMHIEKINEACLKETFDVAAVSSAAMPYLFKNYRILSAGASVGRGYGPVVAALTNINLDKNVTVAIPGEMTTGALLLKIFHPNIKTISMPFDEIAKAILSKKIDAGVLIHEELLNWQEKGLEKIECLGQRWEREENLPIPVGLNIVHKRLDAKEMQRIVYNSMVFAQSNKDKALEWGRMYTIEAKQGIVKEYISMFANEDTLCLKNDCIIALERLYKIAYEKNLIPCIPEIDIVK